MVTKNKEKGDGQMDLSFKVQARIARPAMDVFEAVVNPDELSQYFTTGGSSGRIEAGKSLIWQFADFPGEVPVHIREVDAPRRLVFEWNVSDGDNFDGRMPARLPALSRVEMVFVPLGPAATLVSISETGFPATAVGVADSHSKCSGWTQMLASLKAWLEHGIRLRDGYYPTRG